MWCAQITLVSFLSLISISCSLTIKENEEFDDFANIESSETCFFKAALEKCSRGKKLSTYLIKDDREVPGSPVSVVSTKAACLIAMCTRSANNKLVLSKEIDIGGVGEVSKPDDLKKGFSSNLFSTSRDCMRKASAVVTIRCGQSRAPSGSVGRSEEYEDNINDLMEKQEIGASDYEDDSDDNDATKNAFLKMQDDDNEQSDDADDDLTTSQQDNVDTTIPLGGAEEQEVDVNELKATVQEGTTAKVQWCNWFHSTMHVNCGHKRGLYIARSGHSRHYKDRIWQFHCKTVSCYNFNHCYWSGYRNFYDGPLLVHCNENYIMAGIYSVYHNHYGDRRFQILCCRSPHYYTRQCSLSGFVNGWRGWLNYAVQGQRVFTGLYSYHNDGHEDRRWGFADCHYRR